MLELPSLNNFYMLYIKCIANLEFMCYVIIYPGLYLELIANSSIYNIFRYLESQHHPAAAAASLSSVISDQSQVRKKMFSIKESFQVRRAQPCKT